MTTNPEKKAQKAALKALELREKTADVAKAEIDLESAQIGLTLRKLDQVRSHHQFGLLVDASAGTFRLEGRVDEDVLALATTIHRWADKNPDRPITLYIFSPGGDVRYGFALYDTLRTLSAKGHEITTVIRGFAGSMASVVFLAGDVRKIGAESIVHQHEPSSMAYGKLSEMTDANKFVETLFEKITRIYVSRTQLSRAAFRKLTVGKEWYAEADRALALGVATVVE